MSDFFDNVDRIEYEGPASTNPLAFRWYQPDRVVGDRTMAEHLRFGVCYWHSFSWDGFDIFGAGTLDRPWHPNVAPDLDPMTAARMKMDAAFEFFSKLGTPYFSFHDIDIAPAGATFAETCRYLDEMVDYAAQKMDETGVQLLWGTTNAFSHPRFMSARRPTPTPTCSAARRRRNRALHAEDPRTRRVELRAVGRSRGLRDPAQHRHDT
ncbi:MAG: hypothetical protein R2705_24350 [Ilumatobacteraceae bacterium]